MLSHSPRTSANPRKRKWPNPLHDRFPCRIDCRPASLSFGRVGRRSAGWQRGGAVTGPSSGLRRCLNPRPSPFPTSSSIIPDSEISPVRFEAKTSLHGACPSRAQFKRWCAYAARVMVCSTPRLVGWQPILRTLSSGRAFRSRPSSPRAPLLHRHYPLSLLLRAHAQIPVGLSPPFRAPHLVGSASVACTIHGWSSGPSRFGLPFFPGVLRPLYRRFDECT